MMKMSQLEIGEVVGRGSESTIRIGRKGGKLFCLKLVEVEKRDGKFDGDKIL